MKVKNTRRNLIIVLASIIILASSCANDKKIDNVNYGSYGLFNEGSVKNSNIYYEASGWAVFSGIVFSESIIVPIYVFGYHLWEPKCTMTEHNRLIGNTK